MPAERIAYVTGGTGLLGSHLAERLVNDGYRVRALAREGSDTSFLKALGVDIVRGDITDPPEKLRPGMEGASQVFHCAAYVDDWGPREKMLRVNVDGLLNVLKASHAAKVERVVNIGSLAVYGMGDQVDLDESSSFVETGDNYNFTKIEAERVSREFARSSGLAVVTLRPPYIYGPRDRQFFPRVCATLRDGTWVYLSGGRLPFTVVYVLNLVDACILAAEREGVSGEAFIVTNGASITRRRLVEILCDEMGYEPPTKSVPRWVGKALCPMFESVARLRGAKEPPRMNRFRYKFVAVRLTFDISKARDMLGYNPRYETEKSLRETARWCRKNRTDLLPMTPERAG